MTPADGTAGEGWILAPVPGSTTRRVILLLVGVVAIACGVQGVDDVLGGIALVLIGVSLATSSLVELAKPIEPRDYEGRHGAGLAIPLRPHPRLFGVVAGSAGTGLALLVVAAWLADDVGIGGRIAATLFGGIGALIGLAFTYDVVASRLVRNLMFLLDVQGVTCRTPAGVVVVPWHGITGVRAHWTRAEGDPKRTWDDVLQNWLTIETVPELVEGEVAQPPGLDVPRTDVTINLRFLGTDPELTLAVLRFYLDNPEERGELRTVVALDRVAALRQQGVASPHDG